MFCKASLVFLILSLVVTSIIAYAKDVRQENNIISIEKTSLKENKQDITKNIQVQQREIIVNLKNIEKKF
jgi:hypothetical protein